VRPRRLIKTRSLKGQDQRVGHVLRSHRGAELPGQDVAREVIQHGREIEAYMP
jgi:hypothetical protein